MSILLTSNGFSSISARKKFLYFLKGANKKKALIIITAASGKTRNKYVKLTVVQLLEMGVKSADFFDLEKNKSIKLSDFDIVFVCGGNTFRLMKAARASNFKNELLRFLKRDTFYIGVSAGSTIMGPNIGVAGFGVHGDKNLVKLKDLSGLGIVPYSVFPHFEEKERSSLERFSQNLDYAVKPLVDGDIIFIK